MKSFTVGYLSALAGTALMAVLIAMPWRDGADDPVKSPAREHVRPHAAPTSERHKPATRRPAATDTEATARTGNHGRARAPDSVECDYDCDDNDAAADAGDFVDSTPPASTETSSTPDVESQSPPGMPGPPDVGPAG